MTNAVAKKDETRRTGSAVVPHHPLSVFHKLHNEMNKLFEEAGHGFGLWHPDYQDPFSQCQAKVDVQDNGNDIVITAEIPGVEMNDLEITATPTYISLAGEKHAEKEEKKKGYYRMEREYGYFRRIVPLPCEIQNNNVDAVFKNGVLTLTLPKTAAALEAEKKVTVKAG